MTKGAELVVSTGVTNADITALLQQQGWAEKSTGGTRQWLKFANGRLVTPDGETFMYNPSKPKVPACTVRIVKPPESYKGYFITDKVAALIGQPELAGNFSKKYDVPDANRQVWDSDLAYDDIDRLAKTGTVFDDVTGRPLKSQWKGDMLVQIFPDSGSLTGEEPIYTLSLPATSLVEFRGSYRDPSAGSVSEFNFIHKLAQFAAGGVEGEVEQNKAIIAAMTSLTLGGVAADVRILPAENKETKTSWSVLSFDPIHVEPMTGDDQILIGDGE